MRRFRTWTRIPNVRVFGAPIYAHWSAFLAVAFICLLGLNSPIYAAIAIAAYLAVICIHEIGHAFVARRLGYQVVAIRVAFIHGTCEYEAPDTQWEEVLVAWGGVAAQLLVAAAVLAVAAVIGNRDPGYFGPVVAFLGYVNFLVALLNLAPGGGFDGSVAWRIVPLLLQQYRTRRATSRAIARWAKRE